MTTETHEKITYYLLTAIWSTLDFIGSYLLLALPYGAKLRGFLLG